MPSKAAPAIKQGAIISTVFAMVVAGGSYFLAGSAACTAIRWR